MTQRHRDTEIPKERKTRRQRKLVFCCLALWLCGSVANSFSQTQEQRTQGGASTAGSFNPVKDSSSRPITAGGFVDGAPVYFADVTARAGLQKFRHVSGVADKRYILESPSGGVALFDYDNDGWLDIYLVNG